MRKGLFYIVFTYKHKYFIGFGKSALATLISSYFALITLTRLRAYRVTHDTWPVLVVNSDSDI